MKNWFLAGLARFAKLTRRLPVIIQSEAQECAHACVAMIAGYFSLHTPIRELRAHFPPSTRGTSVAGLVQLAAALGLQSRAFRTDRESLALIKLPCVIHWDLTHFVVLAAVKRRHFLIHDPGIGCISVGESEFWRRFTGIAVELTPSADAYNKPQRKRKLDLGWLLGGLGVHKPLLGSILVLALLLEILSLLAPLMLQIATDSIIPAGDRMLLYVIGSGLLAVALVQAVISVMRRLLLINLAESLTITWNGTVCSRLLQRSYDFFIRRNIGDIHSRFGSIEVIRRTLSSRLIGGALDGFTALAALALIFFYSPVLALLTLGFSVAYAGLRIVTSRSISRSESAYLAAEADQQSLLLETLHGIQSIKVNGKESLKHARFVARTATAAEANSSLQRRSAWVDEAAQVVLRVHRLAAVFAGTLLVLEGRMSPGMLIAYVTYGMQFLDRSARLLDIWTEVRMLSIHVERLGDVVDDPSPVNRVACSQLLAPRNNGLRLESVSYRYGPEDPFILDECSVDIFPGECVAICGASGTGKSTLAKIILGLLEPQLGAVRIGSVDIKQISQAQLRAEIGCVLQDDQLFNGSIADNIAFFEPNYDRERVTESAMAAQIHDEIKAMPMAYDTLIIDMGASLSSGQRQRLILARALYRQPKILLLDEATSHLDLRNEELVNHAISCLSITRIIIAHRPQTLAVASRVLELRQGRLHRIDIEPFKTFKPDARLYEARA